MLIVPLIATVFAGVAVVRYHALDQSTWRGASFGMFASYEYEQGRYLRALVVDDDGTHQVAVPPDLDELRRRAITVPGGPAPREMARALRVRTGADQVVVEIRGHDVEISDTDIEVGIKVLRRVRVP